MNREGTTAWSYQPDHSADESFQITAEGLAENTIYLLQRSVLSGKDGFYEKDAARFVFSLQGLINRDFRRVHSSLVYFISGKSDEFWLQYMMQPQKTFERFHTKVIDTFDAFFTAFASQIAQCGMVLWDEQVPATSNVAATICGLDGYLPVRKCQEEDSFYTMLLHHRVVVKQDLCGMFSGEGIIPGTDLASTGSQKCDAYLWALEKYMHRCSSRYIAYVVDGAGCVPNNLISMCNDAASPFGNCICNHDYYLARRCFFFDLTCVDIEKPCDDPQQPLGTDLAVLKQILASRYQRANGAFGQILGFPPWWLKYTKHLNRGSLVATTVEWIYVTLVTAYNLAKEADAAQPCSMTNGSVYYQYQSSVPAFHNNRPAQKLTFDSKTKYFTYYVGDYDSSAWLKEHVYHFWTEDKVRGQIPLMWSFNPNLSERVPMVFDFIYEQKTKNDFFASGDSGAGYIIPDGLYETNEMRVFPDGEDEWCNYCQYFFERFDLDITGFIINGNYPITPRILKLYNRFSSVGSFHGDSRRGKQLLLQDGVPYIHLNNGVSGKPSRVDDCAKRMEEYAFGHMKQYNFSAYRTICDSPAEMAELTNRFITYAKERHPEYRFLLVDPYTFFDLIRQSGQGTVLE